MTILPQTVYTGVLGLSPDLVRMARQSAVDINVKGRLPAIPVGHATYASLQIVQRGAAWGTAVFEVLGGICYEAFEPLATPLTINPPGGGATSVITAAFDVTALAFIAASITTEEGASELVDLYWKLWSPRN